MSATVPPGGEGQLRVLLVEDDLTLAKPIRRFLERQLFLVSHCTQAAESIEVARLWAPHVILLDLTLPDGDGLDVAREVRSFSTAAMIMITARGRESDRITGLDIGADDYLVKPFGTGELLARINAVLRRTTPAPAATPVAASTDPFRLDVETKRAYLNGKDLGLAAKEFEILRVLLARRGSLVRRDELARAVWGAPLNEVAKSLDVHLAWLRRKLGEHASAPKYLETIRGAGLRIRAEDSEPARDV